ncbi:MAG: hypothetical protein ACJA08_001250 [Cyclobacteriaceae bacterium]|jgi:hypothetical protein
MKLYIIATFLLVSSIAKAQDIFESADLFFSKYVENGNVNYAGIKKEPKMLDDLVEQIANHNLSNKRVTSDYMKALYINAYNVLVIKQVVDRYPIYGPLKVEGFFNGISHTIIGEEMTLDQLEKGTLYKSFPDPRLHFALVCAAKGCPPIADFAYRPLTVEKLLTERTKYVLNLDWFIVVEKSGVKISQIFDWYKTDFEGTPSTQISFINLYRDSKLKEDTKVRFYDYDWSLNE